MRSIPVFSPDSPAYSLSQEVQRQFGEWRQATPQGLRRIPEKLWNSATKLAVSTSVFQVSKLLGLDYSQLKKRVIAICGPNCTALPGRRQGKTTAPQAALPNSDSPKKGNTERPKWQRSKPHSPTTRPLNTSMENCHPPVVALASAISQFRQDGFLEATVATTPPLVGPPLLAEIRSSKGALMRLFSVDTIPILHAFLQS